MGLRKASIASAACFFRASSLSVIARWTSSAFERAESTSAET